MSFCDIYFLPDELSCSTLNLYLSGTLTFQQVLMENREIVLFSSDFDETS